MSNIVPILSNGSKTGRTQSAPVFFHRLELDAILQVYARGVSMGEWRDYSLDASKGWVGFSAYQRATEMPQYRLIKEPALARKQGAFRLVNSSGHILKRGPELGPVLRALEAKLIKVAKKQA